FSTASAPLRPSAPRSDDHPSAPTTTAALRRAPLRSDDPIPPDALPASAPPAQDGTRPDDLPGARGRITGQALDPLAPRGRRQQRDQLLCSRAFEVLAGAHQEVVLDDERHEVDALSGGGGLDAEAGVRRAGGDGG